MLDASGRVWTQQYVYDPGAERIDELTAADGKDFGTGWFHSHARLADGRMLFGGSQGILVVDAQRYQPSTFQPPLTVTELRVDGATVPAAPALSSLVIEPGQRSLSLEFAALDYCEPERLRYAYRLEGFDPDWIATGADRRVASYSNLDPGRYLLRVRATNRSGLWSPHELAIDVAVRPAWWQTAAAQGAAALLGVLAVAGMVQWRTAALRRRGQVLERRVRERTAELERMGAALREASLTDPLTGLRNRRFVSEQLGDGIALLLCRHEDERRAGRPPPLEADMVFFLIDIDHFKRVNDAWGHTVGDAVIRLVAATLAQNRTETGRAARYGGEEFALLLPATPLEEAAAHAERLRGILAARRISLRANAASIGNVTVSIGAARYEPGEPISTWIERADAALYRAKEEGRNRVVAFGTAMLEAG
jgi:diguanylate cyclase (GGDEF)-like protein